MIVEPFSPYFRPAALSVEAARKEGHRVSVSCAEHRVPRTPDASVDGPLAAFQALTWPELFPHLRCSERGAPASKLTMMGQNPANGEWQMLLRICADARPFSSPGLKHVKGSPAWLRHQGLLAKGIVGKRQDT